MYNIGISVIIATRNRRDHLLNCLESVLKNSYKNYEIIIADQSTDFSNKNAVRVIGSSKIKYFKIRSRGKSKALNFALGKSSGKILAFTDDDCIVEKDWLKKIEKEFTANSNLTLLFGKVSPWVQGRQKGKTVTIPNYKILSERSGVHIWEKPDYKLTVISGNNMAMKRDLISQIGKFKEWLGPGSIGFGGDDTEFAYRAAIANKYILLTRSLTIFHNNWLNTKDINRKNLFYASSFFAIFTYYIFFKGKIIFVNYILRLLSEYIISWVKSIIACLRNFRIFCLLKAIFAVLYEAIIILRGLMLPFYIVLINYLKGFFVQKFTQSG